MSDSAGRLGSSRNKPSPPTALQRAEEEEKKWRTTGKDERCVQAVRGKNVNFPTVNSVVVERN